MSETDNRHRVIILGSGPAGLTAALYAARANLAPLVLEGNQPGGQLTITTDVENYPGFPDGILGPALMDSMREQAKRFGAQVKFEQVTSVDFSKPLSVVQTDEGTYRGDALIVATGASAMSLGLESEKQLMGYGVSTCATCDGFFFKGKELVVIGGGDSALEEAIYLTKFATKVTVVHRRDALRASKIMQDRAFAHEQVEFIWDSTLREILGSREEKVRGVVLENVKTGEVTEFPCQGVFIAIGHKPNTGFLKGHIDMDAKGYVVAEEPTTRTNIEGVFACGDVIDSSYRQAVTAAGSGCKAAMDAERWLEAQN